MSGVVVRRSGIGGVVAACVAVGCGVLAGPALAILPVNSAPPTISGTAQENQILMEGHGTWTPTPASYTYQWLRCDTAGLACVNANGSFATYMVTTQDVGHTIRVAESASDGTLTAAPVQSAQTAVVTAAPLPPAPANLTPPTISGAAQQGATLAAVGDTWTNNPNLVTFQWERCDVAGSNCTLFGTPSISSVYSLVAADAGHTMRVVEIASNAGGSSPQATSNQTAVVIGPPANSGLPGFTGTAQQGQTLTEVPGTWTFGPSVAIQWLRCDSSGNACAAVGGANDATYTLGTADLGNTIRVQEFASNADGTGGPATSPASAVVVPPPPTNTHPPQITGSAALGGTMTANPGTWANSPTSLSYQWLQCDGAGTNCTAISGATNQTYPISGGDLGHTLRVQEFASNAGGMGGPVSSGATGVVGSIPTSTSLTATPTALVTNQGVTLIATVTSSSISAKPSGTFTFENHGSPIGGCSNQAVPPTDQSVTLTCQTSFSASTSPEQLVAVFKPSPGSALGGSTNSQPLNLTIRQDSTSIDLQVSSTTANLGSTVTYTATVAMNHTGPSQPSGSVTFLDGGKPLALCRSKRLTKAGTFFNATCKLTYGGIGTHHITVAYSGDGNFGRSSSSSAQTVNIRRPNPHCCLTPLMQWTFFFTPSYARVLTLLVNSAPVGSSVTVACHGHGCVFGKQAVAIKKPKLCKTTSKHKCAPQHPGTMDFASRFRGRHLATGAQITVEITERGWIGKYFSFTIRAGRPPMLKVSCLAPGSTRPGVGC
jgi:hypothetical protein